MYVTINQVGMFDIMLEFVWVLYGLYHRPKVDGQNVMYMNLKRDISGASLECGWGECRFFFDTCEGFFTMKNALHTKIGNLMMFSGVYVQLEWVFNVFMQSHSGM
jgi:hypothetical protein